MVYVVIQFACILILAFNANSSHLNILSLFLIGLACVFGGLAIVAMKLDNLNITPNLKDKHRLVTQGVYRFVRHPMYSSVLFLCTGLMLSHLNWLAQGVWVILLIDLVLKSKAEEVLLNERFKDYSKYQKQTGRFLPFL
jgi:protein-S-isoprenylcysteine O-methyltransferase Ste14